MERITICSSEACSDLRQLHAELPDATVLHVGLQVEVVSHAVIVFVEILGPIPLDRFPALVVACAAVGGKLAPGAGEVWTPVIGTDRLGRAFTKEERAYFERALRAHDFATARKYALLFGRRLSRSNAVAQDLLGRALERLVRGGWDPNEVPLAKRLCRLVWSEWTHEKAEDRRRREAEARFLLEMKVHGHGTAASPENYAVRLEDEQAEEDAAKQHLERLRVELVKRKDNVNLFWLEQTLAGETDMREMARKCGRDVEEFYAASKRRVRIVAALVAEDNGVRQDDGESA